MKKKLLLQFFSIVVLSSLVTFSNAQTWNEVTKIVASERAEEDRFGWSVSISGHFAIVGAFQEDEDESEQNALPNAGAAYILEKDNEGYWNPVQKIVASDRAEYDEFGSSVSISGNYAIVGAIYEDEDASGGNTMSTAGTAYIFKRDEQGKWNQVQKIVASDRTSGNKFGSSVSMFGDYALVGAIGAEWRDGASFTKKAGAVYIFEMDDQDNWNEVQKIYGDPTYEGKFGVSVSISGSYATIGADEDAGVAYFFERDGSGEWNRVSKQVGPYYSGWKEGVVSISGNYAIGGTSYDHNDENDSDSLYMAGSAFIFERNSSGTWEMVQKIVASDRAKMDHFGASVGISGDMLVVGSPLKDANEGGNFYGWAGAAYVFKRNGNGTWEEDTKLMASDYTLGDAYDVFGTAVGISGNYTIISSPYDDEDDTGLNPLNEAGSAYVFSFCSEVAKNNQETICHGDSIMLGGDYQLEAGTFYDTLRAYTGCDSVITTVLTVNVVDTVVTMAETTLTAQAASGSYQWIDCATNQNIQGETSQSFSPTTGGDYAVKLTQNGCVDTSYCYTFAMVGIEDLNLEGSVKVYPNPANNLLNIELDEMYEVINVRIMNILGKEVQQKQFKREQLLRLDISELPSGPYFIQLQTPEGNASIRVVKNE